MVKTVLAVNHQGYRDWLLQRITALVMVVYFIGLLIFFFMHPHLAFFEWHALFAHLSMKIATLIVVLCLLYHAWIGMWTVFTDYIKPTWIRLILDVLVILGLISFFLQTLLILWGI